ncbi:MAG: ABC transporter permease [Bryobacteraceae bacterium]|jgi:predicted permease
MDFTADSINNGRLGLLCILTNERHVTKCGHASICGSNCVSMEVMRNFRYACRMLSKSPGFALVAIVTLALGIGANTAIFSVANALLLRPLPYAHPDRLVLVYAEKPDAAGAVQPFSFPRATFLSEKGRAFSGFAAFTSENFNLTGRGDPEQLSAARVSWNFFGVLGVRPALGRAFLPEEDRPGGKAVCLISHALWTRTFGARADIAGQNITLDATPYTVIGVLPSGFHFAPLGAGVDLWAPRVFDLNITTPAQVHAGLGFLTAVARLAPGIGARQAEAEMQILDRQYKRENPRMPDADPTQTVRARDLQQQTVANVRTAVLILCGAVGLLLLIACANVAALLLSRALGRRKEIAIRAALGASRVALIGQLLAESILLALVGGALGIALSTWGTHALTALGQENLPRVEEIGIDWRVAAFAAGLSLVTGVLFGLFPALQLSRQDLNPVLRAEGRGSAGSRRRSRARGALVVAQVALSLVLLVGAGLLIRSFVRLRSVSGGFDAHNVLTMSISLPPARYPKGPQMAAFYDQVVQKVSAMPGVRSAAVCSALPVRPVRFSPVLLEGQPDVPLPARPILAIQMVSPAYFRTLRVALRQGREFTGADNVDAPLVAVVNETLVRRYWPHDNPIGKHLLLGRMVKPTEVVGVAADVNNLSLAASPEAEVYLPFPQRPWASMNLILRTAGDPHHWVGAARAAVAGVDRDQPVTALKTMEEVLATSTAQQRFSVFLLGVFSMTALVLAAVGLYGVIAYSVAERTQEMGIRLALGAARGDITRMIVGQGLALALAGLVIGTIAALALTRLMSGMLFQVSAADPASFAVGALLLAAIAALASYLPARHATRVDPTEALRYE